MAYTSFPPHITIQPPLPLSPTTTLTHIQSYLDLSRTSHHLHPDCNFDENGPTLAGHSAYGGLVLHQLRRVEAGLRGERLGGEVLLENGEVIAVENGEDLPEGDDVRLDALINGVRVEEAQGGDGDGDVDVDLELDVEEWQTKNVQEQMGEQAGGILEGEVGERNPAVMVGRVGMSSPGFGAKRVWEEEAGVGRDREARKRAKKERTKNMQREKERGRQTKGNIVGRQAEIPGNGFTEEDAAGVLTTTPDFTRVHRGTQRQDSQHGIHDANVIDRQDFDVLPANGDGYALLTEDPTISTVDALGEPKLQRRNMSSKPLITTDDAQRREAKRAKRKAKKEALRDDGKLSEMNTQLLDMTFPPPLPLISLAGNGGANESSEDKKVEKKRAKERMHKKLAARETGGAMVWGMDMKHSVEVVHGGEEVYNNGGKKSRRRERPGQEDWEEANGALVAKRRDGTSLLDYNAKQQASHKRDRKRRKSGREMDSFSSTQ